MQLSLLDYVAPEPPRPPEPGPLIGRRLLLIDGNNLAHRAWYAPGRVPPVESFTGRVVSLGKLVQPHQLIVVFDGDGTTWRHELWPEYKSNRKPKPAGLPKHIEDCRQVCRAARIEAAWIDGVEGDDLLASYVAEAVRLDASTTIVTSDHDLLQLIRDEPEVRVLDPGSDSAAEAWDRHAVFERFGVEPEYIADLKALTGDTSDNYPGVPKIGKVSAAKLITEHGGVESILDRVELISSKKTRERIAEHAELARTCKRLATLVTNMPLPIPIWDGP